MPKLTITDTSKDRVSFDSDKANNPGTPVRLRPPSGAIKPAYNALLRRHRCFSIEVAKSATTFVGHRGDGKHKTKRCLRKERGRRRRAGGGLFNITVVFTEIRPNAMRRRRPHRTRAFYFLAAARDFPYRTYFLPPAAAADTANKLTTRGRYMILRGGYVCIHIRKRVSRKE